MVVARRNLIRLRGSPTCQVFTLIQPIMFVLLFAYVFGGAIPVPGADGDPLAYREFLMAGIFAQTVTFATAPATASGSPTTCTRASSTGSARCRWRARRC